MSTTVSPAAPQTSAPAAGRISKKSSPGLWAAILLAPTLLLLGIIIVYPLISAIQMSFLKDSGLDPATGMFVEGGSAGFSNYTNWLLQQCNGQPCAPGTLGAKFWPSFGNTFFYAAVTVLIETVAGFWMAIIMARTFKGRALLRAAVLVPWAIPTAVTAKLWYFMFDYNGVINTILPGQPILWLGSETAAKWAIVIADSWKTTPFMALLIVAGLQMIPGDVYEAAKMDGASVWQRFRHITLPLVKPALMVAILFRTLDALRMYDLPAILTGGANNTSTLSMLVVEQIRQGFNAASALSTITFFVIFGVAFIFVRFLGADVTSGSGPVKKTKKNAAAAQEASA